MPTSTVARETKTLSFQVKATGIATNSQGQEVGQIEAYGAVFNNVDEGNDRILKGAFARTINNSKSRAKSREKPYLLKMLWQHKTDEVIGGWADLSEDDFGLRCKGDVLLSTQRGREYYELAKAGMIDEFSIIYDVMQGGSHYDKSGVRDLSELRLYSIDPVTFAMNDETYLVGVKSATEVPELKTACGSTSGPIGPRDESWDGSAAKHWIWGKALDDEGNVKPSVAKKYFMRVDGDPSLKGSYGYPFWTNDHISVGGVKAVANALAGARNADAGEDTAGMRRKVERLYGRINSKYPDAEPLVPPWKDDDGKKFSTWQRKSFEEHYNEEMSEDLLEDLQEVWYTAFCKTIVDAFKIGDEPEVDVGEALDAFKMRFMKDWLPRAVECGLSEYLATDDMDSPLRLYGYYGYMSSRRPRSQKAGRSISAVNAQRIQDHIDNLKAMARDHMKSIHSVADDLATITQGSEASYGSDEGTPDDGRQEGKSATSYTDTRGTQERPSPDTVNEDEISEFLHQLQHLKIPN